MTHTMKAKINSFVSYVEKPLIKCQEIAFHNMSLGRHSLIKIILMPWNHSVDLYRNSKTIS